ncbi:MAG TPA: alpha/beta hydrolase [Xanthobacteraceae bacterium]|nr:alpha/beta hydrolase [Xanthobacteraceae bacterium]
MQRREFITRFGSATFVPLLWPLTTQAQQMNIITAPGATLKRTRTKTLEIAYEDSGPEAGAPVVLMHGFPYDPRCFDEVVPRLVAAGCRTITPYIRGYGPTRFLSADTPRSGQQAAMGKDIIDLMDVLNIPSATMGGFDWGGRGVSVAAALWPERVRAVVLGNGYSVQDIAGNANPRPPAQEHRSWYQFYFHTERGRAGLAANRKEFCKLLWQLWSPNFKFDDARYDRTAISFENPDFVDIVIHSYRHRFGYMPGDPELEPFEQRLAKLPPIKAPAIVLSGTGSGLSGPAPAASQARFFTGSVQHRSIPTVGHGIPQEAPGPFADALLELIKAQPNGQKAE